MKKFIIIILCAFCLVGCEKKASYQVIDQVNAEAKISEGAILIDVRTKQEYEEGHIEGAILLPSETIELTIEEKIPDKATPIIVYCRSGNRSKAAAKSLINMGYQNIYDFGAIGNWAV